MGSSGRLRQHQQELAVVYRFIDVLVIVAILWISMQIRGLSWSDNYFLVAVLGPVIFFLCAQGNGVYTSWRTAPFKESTRPLLLSWLMAVFVLLFLAYASKKTSEFSRIAIGTWILAVPAALLAWRMAFWTILRRLREKGYNTRTVAIAGTTDKGRELARLIGSAPDTGMNIIGVYDDTPDRNASTPQDEKVLYQGDFNALVERAREGGVDIIYIAMPMQDDPEIQGLLSRLSDTTASVYFVPDFQAFDLMQSRWTRVGSLPVVSVFETPFMGIEGWAKRLEDVVLSSIIIVIIAIPMGLIALVIKLTTGGPVLFKQDRYGLSGRKFKILKFRTMHVCENGSQVPQATENDDRITPFGALLRRTSLDELPQFFNVLKGDMSIVGPRPHAVTHNEEYRKLIFGYMLRHKVKPGITGWAQVNGWRGETETLEKMEKRIEYDLWYIRNWSLWLDLKLIVKTIFVGFRSPLAY